MHSSKIVVKTTTKGKPSNQTSGFKHSDQREYPLRSTGFGDNLSSSFPRGQTTVVREQTTSVPGRQVQFPRGQTTVVHQQTTSVPGGQVRCRTTQQTFSSHKGPFTTVASRPLSTPTYPLGTQYKAVQRGQNSNVTFDKQRRSKPFTEVETQANPKCSSQPYRTTTHAPKSFVSGGVNDRSKYRHGITNKKPGMADSKFRDEIVRAHNEYRSRHQASPLKHSPELSAYAQKWADQLARTDSFQHSKCKLDGTDERIGENIAMKWSSQADAYTGQETTDQWYSEVKLHKFGVEPQSLSSGHFTQVVWKGSREVGVGKAVTSDGKIIVVANYRPAGNMGGKFTENVLPPRDGKILVPESREIPVSNISSSDKSPNFSRRFDRDRPTPSTNMTTRKEVKTFTETSGSGANKETKVTVETTIIKPDGSKTVTKEVTVTKGESSGADCKEHKKHGGGGFGDEMGKLSLKDDDFFKKKDRHRRSSSSSSSDSSTERDKKGSSKSKPKSHKPQSQKDFIDEALKAHNDKRKLHGVEPLKHAKDLSKFAQKWAEHLVECGTLKHSDCMLNGERLGENVSFSYNSANLNGYNGVQVTDQWYSEISKHNYGADHQPGSGHFTQVVWKGSKEFGIGKALSPEGKCYIVGSYRPAGNMLGSFRDNVLPPKK